MTNYTLHHGDCLEYMATLPDKSIDAVITDPPYGTTACKWDNVIPFEPMWAQLKRVIKPKGAIVLFGSEPFSSRLRMSNLKGFKYDWIWHKTQGTGFLNAWKMPLNNYETVSVFGDSLPEYFPIITDKKQGNIRPQTKSTKLTDCYGARDLNVHKLPHDKSLPCRLFTMANEQGTVHPTQKPVKLMSYLIRTYTLEGETVLDFTCGSGTTGVACMQDNRRFVGIEKDETYFKIAEERIYQATRQQRLF